jgi:hypothetical protein
MILYSDEKRNSMKKESLVWFLAGMLLTPFALLLWWLKNNSEDLVDGAVSTPGYTAALIDAPKKINTAF